MPREPEVMPREPEVMPREPEVMPREPEVIPREPEVASRTASGGAHTEAPGERSEPGGGGEGRRLGGAVKPPAVDPAPLASGTAVSLAQQDMVDLSPSPLPAGQIKTKEWGDSEVGLPPADSLTMRFIREQEGESSQTNQGVVQHEVAVTSGGGGTPARVAVGDGELLSPGQDKGGAGQEVEACPPTLGIGKGEVGAPPQVAAQQTGIQGGGGASRSYAAVAGALAAPGSTHSRGGGGPRQVPGGSSGAWFRGVGGPPPRRRNVVQLIFKGERSQCPDREKIIDMVLACNLKISDLFAVIHPYGSAEFDLSFTTPVGMEAFLSRQLSQRDKVEWKFLEVVSITRQEDIKDVTILIRNESLPPQDISTWLGRYGTLQGPLWKKLDRRGIWTGAWGVKMKLHRAGNTMAHIPSSAFIGRDRLLVFYPGQPKLCFRCGSAAHFSSDCTTLRCVKCGEQGHPASGCTRIKCNLCGEMGHPFSRCPKAHREGTGPAEGVGGVATGVGVTQAEGGTSQAPGQAASDPVQQARKGGPTGKKRRRQDKSRDGDTQKGGKEAREEAVGMELGGPGEVGRGSRAGGSHAAHAPPEPGGASSGRGGAGPGGARETNIGPGASGGPGSPCSSSDEGEEGGEAEWSAVRRRRVRASAAPKKQGGGEVVGEGAGTSGLVPRGTSGPAPQGRAAHYLSLSEGESESAMEGVD